MQTLLLPFPAEQKQTTDGIEYRVNDELVGTQASTIDVNNLLALSTLVDEYCCCQHFSSIGPSVSPSLLRMVAVDFYGLPNGLTGRGIRLALEPDLKPGSKVSQRFLLDGPMKGITDIDSF
jgi:hypothetical protein